MPHGRSRLSLTVRDAVADAPGTLRALAREAGVPHTTLVRIRAGELEASPALAERLATVLERWGELCKLHGFRMRQELYRAEREGQTVYSPRRGGHAPAALREAFSDWVRSSSTGGPDNGSLRASLPLEDRTVSAEWLFGQLWNCTDPLPTSDCEALSIPPESTYARAVRRVKRSVSESRVSPRKRRVSEAPDATPREREAWRREAPADLELGSARERLAVEVRPYPDGSVSRLALAEDEVHVWSVSLEADGDVARRFERCLSGQERRQIARLRFARLRRSRALSRGLLRHALAAYVGLPPESLRFRDGPFGKPELDLVAEGRPEEEAETVEPASNDLASPPATGANLGFNLSHSGDLMLIAVAPVDRVGVDVEQIRPIDQAARLAERYFCASEADSIRAAPATRTTHAFLRAWTRKEAVAKAMGEGIVRSLRRLEVTVGPDDPARLLAIDGDERRAADWSLFHLDPAEGYTGALAIEGRSWRISGWSASAGQFLTDRSEEA